MIIVKYTCARHTSFCSAVHKQQSYMPLDLVFVWWRYLITFSSTLAPFSFRTLTVQNKEVELIPSYEIIACFHFLKGLEILLTQ